MNAGLVKAMIKTIIQHIHVHTFFPSLSHSRVRESQPTSILQMGKGRPREREDGMS